MGIDNTEFENNQPNAYGVWIQGIGWLRDKNNRIFADQRIDYAKAVLRMWEVENNLLAKVELIDESMIGLQDIFLERETLRLLTEKQRKHDKLFFVVVRRWLNGLLGRISK